MRIISKVSNEIKCGNCFTHFEFENSDVQLKVDPPGYDEYDSRDIYFVKCPVCSKQHQVNATQYQKNCVKNRQEPE